MGLAVDDIKTVQENAVLSRLAMQVTLNLDVERILPDFIRRRFIVRKQTLYPNVKKGLFSRILRDDSTLGTITKGVVADVSSQVWFTVIYLDNTFFALFDDVRLD